MSTVECGGEDRMDFKVGNVYALERIQGSMVGFMLLPSMENIQSILAYHYFNIVGLNFTPVEGIPKFP